MNIPVDNIEKFWRDTWDCPVKIVIQSTWGAEYSQHRDAIHTAKQSYFSDSPVYSSISHTPGLGGFATAPLPIGFDIESQDRTVSERAYKRFTGPTERELGCTPLETWVAKEAAFKAAWNSWNGQGCNVSIITEMCLLERQLVPHLNGFTFSFKRCDSASMAPLGKGCVTAAGRFLLGIAVIFT